MEHIVHILEHTFLDSLRLLPVLFLVYLLIEYLEHKNNNKVHHLFMKSKKAGPLFGGLFGCIPQCGFSVIASELYSKRAITLGTLIAVFASTSDEAIPILLAEPGMLPQMAKLILIKLVVAIIAGFIVDIFARKKVQHHPCDQEHHEHHHYHGNCEDCHDGILKSAVIHSLKIFAFIFAVTLALELVLHNAEDAFGFVSSKIWLQPLLTPLVGLIPNCAASVVLTELYVAGGITLGALTGGLCAGAGVGLVVLLKLNRSIKENLGIVLLMYLIGVISGYILQFAGI